MLYEGFINQFNGVYTKYTLVFKLPAWPLLSTPWCLNSPWPLLSAPWCLNSCPDLFWDYCLLPLSPPPATVMIGPYSLRCKNRLLLDLNQGLCISNALISQNRFSWVRSKQTGLVAKGEGWKGELWTEFTQQLSFLFFISSFNTHYTRQRFTWTSAFLPWRCI